MPKPEAHTIPISCPECGKELTSDTHAAKHADSHWPPSGDIPKHNVGARYRAALLRGEPVDARLKAAAEAEIARAALNA